MNRIYRLPFAAAVAMLAAALLLSCASPGRPSGGARDEMPPRFVRSNPPVGATDVSPRRVTLEFDELVNVKDAFTKVVVSPTSASMPRVSSSGKHVYINFQDTLLPETTYTVDFGNAIEDNNEANKLQGFSYWFSTGPVLDTLQISGMVLAARDLEPQQSMLVGVHPADAPDTAFRTLRLVRVAKTDDRGRFTIRGLKDMDYRVFALADANNDYRWDNPQEDIAFTSFTVRPTCEPALAVDTVYDMRTGKVDTVVQGMRTRYLPNDVLLNSFNVNFKQQYMTKSERIDSTRISLIFNAPADTLPEVRLLGMPGVRDWYVTERSLRNDTVTMWLTDPRVIATDTLSVELKYLAHNKQLLLAQRCDTLKFVTVRPRPVKKKERRSSKTDSVAKPQVKTLNVRFTGGASQNVGVPLLMEFDQPVKSLEPAMFHLEEMRDSVWARVPKPYTLERQDTLSLRRYRVDYPWEYGGRYRLRADSLAVCGIYGICSKAEEQAVNVKKRDDYFDLRFVISSLPDSVPAFVELLDNSDKPVRKATVSGGTVEFRDVELGTYYARLVEDRNGNGEYDTGDYDADLQPEYVYYYPKALKITKRWDVEQPWDLTAVAIDLQKPAAIKKNKSDQEKNRRKKDSSGSDATGEEDEVFDPTRNPFDPNDRGRRRSTAGSY